MSYSGAWKRGAVQDTQAEPLGHPEYAAQHMRPGRDERIGSRPPYAAPRRAAQVPSGLTDSGRAYDAVLPDEAPPGRLDGSPPEDHDAGLTGPAGAGRSYRGSRATGNTQRSRDRDAGPSRLLRPLGTEDGRPVGAESHGGTALDQGVTRAMRGDNSLAPNNPEGDGAGGPQRSGMRVQRFYHRRIRQQRQWRPDLRAIRGLLAGQAVNSPPLATTNRYTSPFGTLASGRTRTQSAPSQRRTPRPWAEDVTDDGSTALSASGQGLTGWGL